MNNKEEKYVTFVCTGNTCRSPMAERLFLHAIAAEKGPISKLKAVSAGVGAFSGDSATTNCQLVLKDCGLELDGHRAQLLTQDLIDKSLVLFCMTQRHMKVLHNQYKNTNGKAHLIREFIPDTNIIEIPDPFGGNVQIYKDARDSIVEAIPHIIKFLKEKYFEDAKK